MNVIYFGSDWWKKKINRKSFEMNVVFSLHFVDSIFSTLYSRVNKERTYQSMFETTLLIQTWKIEWLEGFLIRNCYTSYIDAVDVFIFLSGFRFLMISRAQLRSVYFWRIIYSHNTFHAYTVQNDKWAKNV